ncbi:hypothetical protein EJ08DRAFT_647189 [Tothia fuscella]|uniref:Uncharacterized protein n=1 Tax=Tothia fuscella TaxID=1048955 RepID=A0A9P4NW99_9PEZI|nr:hypothetical protein EJ08DRAFT_647189 [Tothia fuscella]
MVQPNSPSIGCYLGYIFGILAILWVSYLLYLLIGTVWRCCFGSGSRRSEPDPPFPLSQTTAPHPPSQAHAQPSRRSDPRPSQDSGVGMP